MSSLIPDRSYPLAVDLDGTLHVGDIFVEGLLHLLKTRPLIFAQAIWYCLRGRLPEAKMLVSQQMLASGSFDPMYLAYRPEVLAFLEQEYDCGRQLVLATGAAAPQAQAVAAHLGIFDGVLATDRINLTSGNKAEALNQRFPNGFVYMGDSKADGAVWQKAVGKIRTGNSKSGSRAFANADDHPGQVLTSADKQQSTLRTWLKLMRWHQWTKNGLLFLPLFLAHEYTELAKFGLACLGFILLCAVTSATYIINDILDLANDRQHQTKKHRPLASSLISIHAGFGLSLFLLVGGLTGAALISGLFFWIMLAYVGASLAYSLKLKTLAMIDCYALCLLWSSRIAMGGALTQIELSRWLILFAVVFFFGLSIMKRYNELQKYGPAHREAFGPDAKVAGRGYNFSDAPLLLSLAVGAMFTSSLVLVIYLVEGAQPEGLYRQVDWLWGIPGILFAWQVRVLRLAYQRKLDDDPISFAIGDLPSWSMLVVIVSFFSAAKFL